jgi:hypothetical protein
VILTIIIILNYKLYVIKNYKLIDNFFFFFREINKNNNNNNNNNEHILKMKIIFIFNIFFILIDCYKTNAVGMPIGNFYSKKKYN